MPPDTSAVVGAILAGGASRRFGSPKALARVGGRRIVDRVRHALEQATDAVVVIANDAELLGDLGLPVRGDGAPGLGPLAGIEAALQWAGEMGSPGALCISCDLPFASAVLLREIVARGDAVHAVVPESARGMEPLCAWYPTAALPAVRRQLASDGRSLRALLAGIATERMSIEMVWRFGDPDVIFFNVNTPADLFRAEEIARQNDAAA